MNPAIPTQYPSLATTPDAPDKRLWLVATGATGGAAALATAVPFESTFAPSGRARTAGGPVEVGIADIPLGGTKTVEWLGKPDWVVRRTPEMVAALQGYGAEVVAPMSAQDQQPGYAKHAARTIRPEVFVAIGICTHLGCSPSSEPKGGNNPSLHADWPAGFVYPCHASTFDSAGRVLKNKWAPTNLEIQPNRYAGDTRIQIGDDAAA